MDIDLAINGTDFRLGDRDDAERLAEAGFRRPNPLQRLLLREGRHERRYGSDDCTVSCFREAFDLYPCTDGYLDRDRQWRTGATLVYQQGSLVAVRFRVIEGRYAAPNFYDRFLELCERYLGEPSWQEYRNFVWNGDGVALVCSLDDTAQNAAFDWALSESPL
jgi:hypothetical protein